jgi:hypothetical protein
MPLLRQRSTPYLKIAQGISTKWKVFPSNELLKHHAKRVDGSQINRFLGNDQARLAVLLSALTVLVLIWKVDLFQSGGAGAVGQSCPSGDAPKLATVAPARLAGFKRDLEGMIAGREARFPGEKGLTPYEQGVVSESAAWTDAEPGNGGVPASGRQPGGFEMRWWTVGRDDVVADIFLFGTAADAKQYLDLAASPECRSKASLRAAPSPPGAQNLEWSNPFAYAQQDVYLQRGPRVYRVSVVQPAVHATVGAAMRLQGFHLVNELACDLPGAGCGSGETSSLV